MGLTKLTAMQYEQMKQLLINAVDQYQGELIMLTYMSQDKKIIPAMIKMLEIERENKKELVQEMNLNLTRNTFAIMHPEITMGNGPEKQKEFYLSETKGFYKKYEDSVKTAGMKLWDDIK